MNLSFNSIIFSFFYRDSSHARLRRHQKASSYKEKVKTRIKNLSENYLERTKAVDAKPYGSFIRDKVPFRRDKVQLQ